MPSRRRFLAGSAAVGAGALSATAGTTLPAAAATRAAPEDTTRPPNLVVVLADDLGRGEVGAYGQRLIATPRIDRLAAEGLRFTDAYSTAAVCAPSRCSLLTGLHTGHATVRANPSGAQGALTATDTTFAEVLRARGYRTGLFGKWGFGPEAAGQPSHPNARGFDEFHGYIDHGHAHQYYPAQLWRDGTKEAVPANAGGAKGAYAPELLLGSALDFVDRHADRPFLLFLAPTVPHAPSDAPGHGPYADRPWTAADKGHAAQVSLLDSHIGRIVDRLRAHGLDRDTVLILASDNGPHEEGGVNPDHFDANGPLRGYKRNLYEGGIRVPLIAWGPGRVLPGTSDRPTPLTDLLPTLAELGGAPAPADVDGLSAAPLLTGGAAVAARHDHLYWYRDERGVTGRANSQDGGRATWLAEALRKDRWKAVRFAPVRDRTLPDDQWQVELYDLATDLGETSDVAARHPATTAELVALMRASWRDTYPRTAFGTALTAPGSVVPGEEFTVTAVLANGSARPWSTPALALAAPAGWTVRATTPTGTDRLAAGARLTASWRVTVPAGAAPATPARLTAEGTALAPGGPVRYAADATSTTVPPAPTRDGYLSDLPWISAVNGWGPVERDASNGKNAAGDGTPIAFGGTTYAKGLGVHAYSSVSYHLGGVADRFTALVGIDDFSARQSALGATRATVHGDGRVLATTGVLTAAGGPVPLDVDVRGVRVLRLEVSDANDRTSFDHTSWARAHISLRA
ncbi:sulfatase-like hydrolase/transferase [Streptomyces sp. NPDC056049]|uniref:sulfatase-like hydrolase/transferase n=1 Tax=Streptomyces sp. NPDC056049 TaxID=3345693 RepID=UPI0035DAD020